MPARVEGFNRPQEVTKQEQERISKQKKTQQAAKQIQTSPTQPKQIVQPSKSSPTGRLGETSPEIKKEETERIVRAQAKTELIKQVEQEYPGYQVAKAEPMMVEGQEGYRFTLQPIEEQLKPSPSQGYIIPPPERYRWENLTEAEKQKVMQSVFEDISSIGLPFAIAVGGPIVGAKALIIGAGISTGISEVYSLATTGKHITVEEAVKSAITGGGIVATSGLAMYGLSSISPKIAFLLGGKGASSVLARATVSSGVGAGSGYVLSGGDIESTWKGAAVGFGFSIASDVLITPGIGELRARLPKWMPGSVERLNPSGTTMGKMGEAQTYQSKPMEKLSGKSLRVVGDVTENPVGTGGVTLQTLIDEYVGELIPTAHATLNPSDFSLSVGGETILKGYPSEGAGFRASQELYPFYSAPGSKGVVTVYGGYAGVGEGYSIEAPKIVFGGKPTALITLETKVSSDLLRQAGESIDDYLTRFSRASGKTGLSPETVIGVSAERQLSTPTTYMRKGETLPGSLYISEGKVGTFQIKEMPKGTLGKIPIIRTMLSRYTYLTVYKGSYAPVATTQTPSIVKQESKPVVNIPSRSVISISVSPSPIVTSKPSIKRASLTISRVNSKMSTVISKINSSIKKSTPSLPSKPSKQSLPSYQRSLSSISSKSYSYSKITQSTSSSVPSLPSISVKPSKITVPVIPSFKGSPLKPTRIKGGLWRKRKHPIPTPEEITTNILGKRRGKR